MEGSSFILVFKRQHVCQSVYMNQFENSVFQNLMVGEFAGEGDLIQLITDEDGEDQGKEDV